MNQSYNEIQIICAQGDDCIKFLQGQLTNDLTLLTPDNPIQLNGLCNQKGRLSALFFVSYLEDNKLLLALPTNLTNQVITTLQKYAVFSKISFDLTTDYRLIYNEHESSQSFLLNHSIMPANSDTIDDNNNLLLKKIICQKLAFINLNNTEKFLPAELHLDQLNAVSYKKGCFMGQEIVARMKYRGNLKKTLFAIETETTHPMSDQLYDADQKKIADVVNQVNINDKSYILAVFNQNYGKEKIILDNDILANIIA